MEINEITNVIIGSAIKIHSELRPGLLESAYSQCLAYELSEVGLKVEREKVLPDEYKGIQLECGYRIDLMVEDKVIVELKVVKNIEDVHMAQILAYLKWPIVKLGY